MADQDLEPCPFNCTVWNPKVEEIHDGDGETPYGFRIICYGCLCKLSGRTSKLKRTTDEWLNYKWFKYNKTDREYHETKEHLIGRWNARKKIDES